MCHFKCKILLSVPAQTLQANILHLDQEAMKCGTCMMVVSRLEFCYSVLHLHAIAAYYKLIWFIAAGKVSSFRTTISMKFISVKVSEDQTTECTIWTSKKTIEENSSRSVLVTCATGNYTGFYWQHNKNYPIIGNCKDALY